MESIWGEKKERQKDAEWLKNFQRDFEYKRGTKRNRNTPENIKKILRKMPSRKVPYPDFVQGFL